MQSATKSTLSNLVEEHITSLIREAAVVNRHTKRGGIVSAADSEESAQQAVDLANGIQFDISGGDGGRTRIKGRDEDNAAKLSCSNSRPRQRRRLIHHEDVNLALMWRGSEKLYVSGAPCVPAAVASNSGGKGADDGNSGDSKKGSKKDTTKGKSSAKISAAAGIGGASGSSHSPLVQLLENSGSGSAYTLPSLLQSASVPRIDLNAYARSECAARPPCELGMTVHWLSIDGESPRIAMNDTWNIHEDTALLGSSVVRRMRGDQSVLHRIEDDDDTIRPDVPLSGTRRDKLQDTTGNSSSIRIRELQRRILSEELQLYFARVTTTIESSPDLSEVSMALHGIRTDGGIQELVPFLSRFVAAGLTFKKNLLNTEMCRRLVRVFNAMLDNPNLHLDLHLHQMFTPVGTCVVARKLSTSPYDDHWSLREEAARCLIKACHIYGEQYTSMKPRVVKLLTQQALRIDRPLPTQYGGILGVSLFGPRAIDAFLLPLARRYWERWEIELAVAAKARQGGGDVWRQYELHQCQQALLSALGIFMQNVTADEQAKRVDATSFVDVFGERLIPMMPEPSDYIMAVL